MPRLSSLVVMATATALLAGGCSASVTSPTPAGPVRITVSQNPTFVGGVAIFSVRIENVSQSRVDLTFPSSCQVLPYFAERKTGRAVTPVGGGFGCATVITQLSIGAGESILRTVTVKPGTVTDPQAIVLPPGEYTIQVRLEDFTYKVTSEPVVFTV